MASLPNEKRGLRIRGTSFGYLTEGAYGVIFLDRDRGRIRKVYRARSDASVDHCRQVFEAETQAYERAANAPDLCELVPGGFHLCPAQTVIDLDGNVLTGEFHEDLAFEVDFLDCKF